MEEIIIDGVDVAGCEFYFEDNGIIAPDGTPEQANICASPEKSCENSDSCYCNKDCYYKQLKRLEQENAELKAENSRLKSYLQEIKTIAEQWINNDWSCFHCRSNMDEKLQDILDLITKAEEE